MTNENFGSISGILAILGIIFGTDRLIGYSLISVGVFVSVLHWIRSRNRGEFS